MAPLDAFEAIRTQVRHKEVASSDLWLTNNLGFRHPALLSRAGYATRPGRPLDFYKAIYARRNAVERCINRLKQWRGLATR